MFRRVEVLVESGREESFVAAVDGLGYASIAVWRPDRSIASSQWTKQAKKAAGFVHQFEQVQDPETAAKIDEGVQRLMCDTLRHGRIQKREGAWYLEQLSLEEFRQRLVSIFSKSIPEQIPEHVHPAHPKGGVVFRNASRLMPPSLSPTDVIVLIEHHGLADGQPKTGDDIGKMLQRTGANITEKADRATLILYNYFIR